MVEWLAGNRIRGTSAEKPALALQSPSVGGWKELGRTTLGSANATIDVTSLADKRYLMMLSTSTGQSAGANTGSQFNADTGSNYSTRRSNNGGADYTDVNFSDMEAASTGTTPYFQVAYASNLASKEKLMQSWLIAQTGAGAGNAPFRNESVGKWANTSNAVSSYQWITSASATFNSGSEVVVLGWDPDDTHTTNFWEELASVTNSGGSTNNFGTGSFTAKKYLWVQAFVKNDGVVEPRIRVGTGGSIDTGTNIASRTSSNGGSDGTATSRDDMVVSISGTSENHFINMFMVNNTSSEKLAIHNCISVGTAGAGTAPQRREGVSKYTNTSAQVNIIEIEDNAASTGIADGTIIKVWGSD